MWTGEGSGGGSEDSPVRGQAREGVGWITSPARAGETYSEADCTGTSTITRTDTGTSSRNLDRLVELDLEGILTGILDVIRDETAFEALFLPVAMQGWRTGQLPVVLRDI